MSLSLKRLFHALLFLQLAVGWVQAADLTYRVIGESQKWQGEIELSQPVMVAAGVELSIAPGTRITALEQEAGIRVEGSVQAIGTAAQPIVFETPAGWRGLELYQSNAVNRFEYVHITSARVGLSSSLSRFEMKQSRFDNCTTAIKLHRQTSPLIEQSEFIGNQIAIDIGTRSQVVLRQNYFIKNSTAVMASHNSSGSLLENQFVENQQAIHLQHLFPGQVSGNLFENNGSAVICDQTMASPQIEENRFVNNQRGVVCLLASKPQVRLNRFENNRVALVNSQLGSPQVEQNLFYRNRLAIKSERRSAPQIAQNQFEGNDLALLCDYLSYPTVKQNNFVDNTLAVKLGDHQSADMEKQGVSDGQLQKFLAESGKPGKMAIFTPASGVVDVSNNWWGTDLTKSAEQLFFDRQQAKWVLDDTSGERYLRDRISYSPWLQQPVANAGIK